MSKLTRVAVLLVVLTQISGCISATYVSSIGMREKHGKINTSHFEKNGDVKLEESEMYASGGPCAAFIPYISLNRKDEGKIIGSYTYEIIKEPSDKFSPDGLARVSNGNGMSEEFSIQRELTYNNNAEIFKKYRKWYGYPAQTLQIIAMPLDIAIIGVAGAVALVALPVVAVVHALSPDKDKKSNKSFKADAVPARP